MRLTETAIEVIREPQLRLKIAQALGVTEQTVIRYISDNHENLTKAASLKVIKNNTDLTDDEILSEMNDLYERSSE